MKYQDLDNALKQRSREEVAELFNLTRQQLRDRIKQIVNYYKRSGQPVPYHLRDPYYGSSFNPEALPNPKAAPAHTNNIDATVSIQLDGIPRSEEDLLERFGFDPEEWVIYGAVPNMWGNPSNPNAQAKLKLAKKNPVALEFEPIKPIRASFPSSFKYPHRTPQNSTGVRTEVDIADTHFGFRRDEKSGKLEPIVDRKALDIVFQLISKVRPQKINILGDLLDLPDFSDKFVRRPEFANLTQEALIEAHFFLSRLRQLCPDAEILLIEGNHDARWERHVLANTQAAFGIMPVQLLHTKQNYTLPYMLDLETLGITYSGGYPDSGVVDNETGRRLIHGTVAAGPGATEARVLSKARRSTHYGHCHHAGYVYSRDTDTSDIISVGGPGCLCRTDGIVPARSKENNWVQGISVLTDHPAGYQPAIEHVVIDNGTAMFRGQLFQGSQSYQTDFYSYAIELGRDALLFQTS